MPRVADRLILPHNFWIRGFVLKVLIFLTTRANGHGRFGHFSSWFARAMAKHIFAVCGQVLMNNRFKVNFTYHELWLLKLVDEELLHFHSSRSVFFGEPVREPERDER